MYIVYKIEHIDSLNSYTGYTSNVKNRFEDHLSALNNKRHCCPHLQYAWTKYGPEAFRFEIIGEYSNEGKALEAEGVLESFCFLAGTSYNAIRGGGKPPSRKGISPTEEAREKQRQKMSGENNPFYGKKPSEESLEKMKPTMFKSGDEPWNKGKSGVYSEEHLKQMSEQRLGKPRTQEFYICVNCRKEHKPTRKGRCNLCSIYFRRCGREKPLNNVNKVEVMYKAFGEEKTINQWSKDPRCKISKTILKDRLQRSSKWGIEEAMTAPVYTAKLYSAFGEEKTLRGWFEDSRCIVLKKLTLWNRITRFNMTMEEAVITPVKPRKDV